jgi:hypothetical protein
MFYMVFPNGTVSCLYCGAEITTAGVEDRKVVEKFETWNEAREYYSKKKKGEKIGKWNQSSASSCPECHESTHYVAKRI